jgi:hypothetical protein
MTPARRRPATPASQGPTRTAPDVPIVADPTPVPGAKTKDGTRLLGPEGDPIAREARTGDAGGDSPPTTEAGQVEPEDRATSPRRSRARYPLPVWPD